MSPNNSHWDLTYVYVYPYHLYVYLYHLYVYLYHLYVYLYHPSSLNETLQGPFYEIIIRVLVLSLYITQQFLLGPFISMSTCITIIVVSLAHCLAPSMRLLY